MSLPCVVVECSAGRVLMQTALLSSRQSSSGGSSRRGKGVAGVQSEEGSSGGDIKITLVHMWSGDKVCPLF